MRKFLMFNVFREHDNSGMGYGHVEVLLPEGRKLDQQFILDVEYSVMANQPKYLMFKITSMTELDS